MKSRPLAAAHSGRGRRPLVLRRLRRRRGFVPEGDRDRRLLHRVPHQPGAAERYQKVKPDVTVVVRSSGTGGGFGKYKEGEIDIVDASRTAKPEEEEAAKAKDMPWTSFHVGFDGITMVVHPSNDFVKSLTVAQLKAMFEKDSKVKTWKDVDPNWPAEKITFYTPDKDSGTYEYFVEAILGKGKDQRDDVQPGSDDNVLVTGVAGENLGSATSAMPTSPRTRASSRPCRSRMAPTPSPSPRRPTRSSTRATARSRDGCIFT